MNKDSKVSIVFFILEMILVITMGINAIFIKDMTSLIYNGFMAWMLLINTYSICIN